MSKSIYSICQNPKCSKELIKWQTKYCSKSCAAKINNIGIIRNPNGCVDKDFCIWPNNRLKNCAVCSKLHKNNKYCSVKCANSCIEKRNKDSELKKGPEKECAVCGKLHKNNRWCSRKCMNTTLLSHMPYRELFTENSNYSRGGIKKVILRDKLKKYECKICGIGPMWNDKPMPLILDHINGKNRDHRLENLRFVCSNCDTQLPTYKSKNR